MLLASFSWNYMHAAMPSIEFTATLFITEPCFYLGERTMSTTLQLWSLFPSKRITFKIQMLKMPLPCMSADLWTCVLCAPGAPGTGVSIQSKDPHCERLMHVCHCDLSSSAALHLWQWKLRGNLWGWTQVPSVIPTCRSRCRLRRRRALSRFFIFLTWWRDYKPVLPPDTYFCFVTNSL